MRPERIQLLNDVCKMLEKSSYFFLCTYKGLTVEEFSGLRDKLAEHGANCKVIKNSYIALALRKQKIEIPGDYSFTGDTAVVFGDGDSCTIAKLLKDFSKKQKKVGFKGGLLQEDFLSDKELLNLADLPSKEVLQAQLLGVLEAPKRNLAVVLNNKVLSIVYALQAYKNKIEKTS
ncbi:MAG: 50S ribosomal protein L10 [Verrucomicrobiota bacterium]|nr:50S ribosomal protein L10 [Verrucomicrobiota bacterium]